MAYGLGVDIGGTKIASVIINENADILCRSEVKSRPNDESIMFKQVVLSIEEVLAESKINKNEIVGMGVGVPGKVDCQNGIAIYQNNLPWRNFPITEKLHDYFPSSKITIDNDVYMAAFAEWKLANTDNLDTFVYVTISTGVSCSIIHKGSFVRGSGFAGEIGLFPVLSEFSPKGVANMEQSVSGSAIQKIVETNFEAEGFSIIDFFQEYQNGNPITHSTMNKIIKSLAHGIYSIVCLLDPHRIVFGGGVINKNPFLLDLIKDEIKNYLIPEQFSVLERMKLSRFKENSGIVGAGLKGLNLSNDSKA
ncbi:glucokinase [Lentibacillus kapialis]|uniref:Glucokinase n=1 Tax=Lentibacillus kapialis TaxID=340214 RepID=A0A917Q164_9BACI|nr:ROK family protein [Lentibacillus kapialis]GGK03783.1 glucokinase [Lentibacillus kapialis]